MASHEFAVIKLLRNKVPRVEEDQVMIIAKKKIIITDCKTVMLNRYLLVHLNINLFLFGSLFELSKKKKHTGDNFSGLAQNVN